ncbi:MAG TPA: hypothetical protein PLN52_03190, partial [Opitutaceae bacterium]|nr:hypothetical protein [Opitutaceae bacterium]
PAALAKPGASLFAPGFFVFRRDDFGQFSGPMKLPSFPFRLVIFPALLFPAINLPLHGQEASKGPTSVAGSDQALEVIRSFPGRGALADGSKPTPAEEAMKTFTVAPGYRLEL